MESLPNEELDEQAIVEQYEHRLIKLVHLIEAKEGTSAPYLESISQKVLDWQKIYGDTLRKYRLYHKLIGSTPQESDIIALDLPGEDNVENFVAELENKYK